MEDIKEQAKKEIDDIWEKEIKKSFTNEINKCLVKTLKELKDELDNFDSSINQHIQNLDDKFNEKWEKKFNEQLSQIQQMKNNSNLSNIPINNIRNNNIQNNNIQNINIINNNDNNDYNDNYDINDINNINDNNNNDNNQIFEDYENLRK